MLRVLTTERLLPQSGRTPPRVINLYKVHKVDGPHQGLKTYTKKWTDPTKGHKLMRSPQSGRTPPRVKNLYKVQKVDGPNKGRTYITPKKENGLYQRSRPQST